MQSLAGAMSQHRAVVDGKEWLFGFDNPCGGYFATRFLSDEEAEETGEEADVRIGFGRGVDLETLVEECLKHGFYIEDTVIQMLRRDELREKGPITPLQARVLGWAEEAGVFD